MEIKKSNSGLSCINVGVITLLVSGFVFIISTYEFIQVGLLNKTSGYPFGGEGPTPWYYISPETYANYNLAISIIYLLLLITAIIMMRKKNKMILYLILGITVVLTVIQVAMA